MSRFRKGNQFPDLNTPGDPRTLAAIERRTPSIAGGSVHHYHGGTVLTPKKHIRMPSHPFKIFVKKVGAEIQCSVNYGRQYRTWVKTRTGTPPDTGYDGTQDNNIPFAASNLTNHPEGLTAGYEVLSVSTTYGIWARASYTLIDESTNFFGTATGNGRGYVKTDTYALFVSGVEVDSINTTPDSYDSTGSAHLFIGSVAVDANGVWTIKQYWKSDIVCPSFVMPYVGVSTDTGNSLSTTASADLLLFCPPIVSTDANNSITTGSDDGAFYNSPPFASADANNSISTGSDGGPFYDAP